MCFPKPKCPGAKVQKCKTLYRVKTLNFVRAFPRHGIAQVELGSAHGLRKTLNFVRAFPRHGIAQVELGSAHGLRKTFLS